MALNENLARFQRVEQVTQERKGKFVEPQYIFSLRGRTVEVTYRDPNKPAGFVAITNVFIDGDEIKVTVYNYATDTHELCFAEDFKTVWIDKTEEDKIIEHTI